MADNKTNNTLERRTVHDAPGSDGWSASPFPLPGDGREALAGHASAPSMPKAMVAYVRIADSVSGWVGLFAMYLIFAMMGVLLWSAFTKSVPGMIPSLWTLEMAQFLMVAYFLLGGAWSIQQGEHVRMDLLYGRWSPRTKAAVDAFTCLFLLFYLCVLLWGGISSTQYALEYGERSYSAWRPYMAPIKIVMVIGVALALLQAVAVFFKDLGAALGRPIVSVPHEAPPEGPV